MADVDNNVVETTNNVIPESTTPALTGAQQIVASVPTSTFAARVEKLRLEIAEAASVKSVELAQQKEINKLPITNNSFEAAYGTAAKSPDYETFKVNAAQTAPELGPDRLRDIYAEVRNSQSDNIANQGKGKLFSDATINDSPAAYTANVALGAVGRVGDIVGNLLNVGAEIPQAFRRAGITEDEYAAVKSVKQKEDVYQDSVDALRHEPDEAKKEILRERVIKNSPDNYTAAEQAIFQEKTVEAPDFEGNMTNQTLPAVAERLKAAKAADSMKATVDSYSGLLTDVVNTSSLETMMQSAWADYKHISPAFGTGAGNTAGAVVDLAVEAGKTIIDNPAAMMQLIVQTVPDVITAGRAMPAALAGNFSEKQMEAKQIYRDTYGEDATGDNLAKLNTGAAAAALLDTFSDKLIGSGGGVDLTKLAASVGLKTGSAIIDTTAKVATKLTQATTLGAVEEFVAEGGSNALTQLAGKQNTKKVDLADAYAEGVMGAGAGGAIATVTNAMNNADELTADLSQKMQARTEAKAAGSIKDLVSDISTMDIAGATAVMKHVVTNADSTPQQKAEAVRDLEGAFDQRAFLEIIVNRAQIAKGEGDPNPNLDNTIARGSKILSEMDRAAETLKVTKDGFAGTSVEAAYKTLTEEPVSQEADVPAEVNVEASRQAATVITDEVNSPYSNISTEMARDILDKRADILSPEQVSSLRSYVTTNEAMDNLTDTMSDAKVRSDIVKGGNGNIGARTYVNAIISSIKVGDAEGAVQLATDLSTFANRHMAKANAMQQIVASFDAGTPMPAAQQVALMAPFDSKVKASKFKPFVNAVPRYARMIGEEANMLNIVSTEMNSRVESLAVNPQAGSPAATDTPINTNTSSTTVPNVSSTTQPTLRTEPMSQPGDATQAGRVDPVADGVVATTESVQTDSANRAVTPGAAQAEPGVTQPVSVTGTQSNETVTATQPEEDSARGERERSDASPTSEGEAEVLSSEQQGADINTNPSQSPTGGSSPGRELQAQSQSIEPNVPADSAARGAAKVQPDTVLSTNLLQDLINPEQNLVSKFLQVKATKVEGNPIANDPDFISKLHTNGISFEAIRKYLPQSFKSLNEAQLRLLNNFLVFNEGFRGSINEVLGDTPTAYAYSDAINYLRNASGALKTSVVDAMSVSAFNWLVVNSNDSLIKTNEDIGSLLDIDSKNKTFDNYTWQTLGQAGVPFNETALSLGNEIISNLGLALNSQDAPHTLMARLATSIGGRALMTMGQMTVNNEPIVKMINVTGTEREIAHLIEKENLSETKAKALVATKDHQRTYGNDLRTIQVSYQRDNFDRKVPNQFVQDAILTPARDAKSILNTLFNSLEAVAMPSFTPVSSADARQVMKRTDRKLSQNAKNIIDKFNSTKTYLKPGMVKVAQYFNADELSEMFGFQTELKTKVHKDDLKSENSKNDLIKRNVEKVYEFLNHYSNETKSEDFSTPFYLDMETTRVNRAQVTQSHMNMQSDKTARHMAYQEGWKAEIAFADKDSVNKFMLAVGQALGVGIDKNYNTESLEKTKAILADPVIADGVIAAVALLNNTATSDQMLDIKNAVMAAGKNAAALDGILAYAGYVNAFDNGARTFTSELGIENDGVTNGPMITLTQFAEANEQWANDLKAGGIYFNSTLENVVDAKRQGNADVYEKVTLIMDRLFKSAENIPSSKKKDAPSFKLTPAVKDALSTLFGVLTKVNDEGNLVVTPDGRTVAKSVVTPKTYQASDAKTQAKLGDEAVKAIRKHLAELNRTANDSDAAPEKVIALKSEAKAIHRALNELAPNMVTVPLDATGRKDYLNASIAESNTYRYESVEGPKIVMTFPQMLAATYGAMFTNAVNFVNKSMEDATKDTVVVTNMAVMLYEQARTNLIAQAVAAKAANGEGKTVMEKELTVAEINLINQKLQAVFPEVMTAVSDQEGTGVSLVESNNSGAATGFTSELALTEQTKPAYTVDGKVLPVPKKSYITTPAQEIYSPGVRGVVNMVLATDGAIALRGSAKSSDLLSLYDAYMSGVLEATNDGREWNRAMYKTVRDHSIPVNTAKMINKVLAGYTQLFGNTEFGQKTLEKYALYDYVEGGLNTDALSNIFDRYTNTANRLQEAKRQALVNNVVTFNHYYSEGAAVTFVNGKAVNTKPEDITREFISSIETAVDIVKSSPNGDDVSADTTASKIADQRIKIQASADNDLAVSPELSDAFANTNVLPIKTAVNLLASSVNSATTNAVSAIAQQLIAKLNPDTVVVKYDSRTTYEGELAWLNTNQDMIQYASNSRGMFFPKEVTGGKPTIVLMAETMPHTGMTKETLFHEVVHNLFDERVFANAASPVGTELQSLVRTVKSKIQSVMDSDPTAKQFIDSHGGAGRFPGLSNMREFVAWGLSSAQFQNILKQISHVSVNELDNKLNIKPKTVLAKFRDLVQKVIFNRDIKATTNEAIDNALSALITVSLATQQGVIGSAPSVSRQQGPMNSTYQVSKLNSKALFKTLKNIGHVKSSGTHETFLESMLNTVVNSVLQPLSVNVITTATNESAADLSAHDKLEIFVADNAGLSMSNLPPEYGFNKSAQELYVHGLYMAVLEEGLKVGSAHLNAANDFFNRAHKAMTYKDFIVDPTNVDPVAIANAQARYDSVFAIATNKITVLTDASSGLKSTQERSDYLRNFLALAATNEQFRNALDKISVPTKAEPTTLFERIVDFIGNLIDLVSDRITGVNSALSTTVNIDRLTSRLVGAELRAQSQAEKVLNSSIEYTSYALGGAVNVFRKSLAKLGSLPSFKNNPLQSVRVLSTFARITGNNRTEFLFSTLNELMQRLNQGKQTFVGELASEMKGTTKDNAKVHSLLRVANFTLDRGRKAVIEAMSKTLNDQFKGDLTKAERTAITKQVLRTDMSSLIRHGYSLDNLADMLDDTAYLDNQINKFEMLIRNAVPTDLATFYLNQAEDLGFTMVNGFSSNSHAIPNAYGIARLWETGRAAPDANVIATVEPLIDGLASLRAIQRSSAKVNNTIAADVIRREYSRTDGDNGVANNGMVFLLTTHNQLKEKALAENFGGKPALMRKGYTPDINNPYIDVKTAPIADRALMKEMGYKEAYEVEKDPTDPNPGAMAMFIGDGAGMAQYMRGALSTTSQKTKGTLVKDYPSIAVMHAKKFGDINSLFSVRVSPNYGRNQAYMQPVFNEDGQIADYRYVMAEATKDELLSRDDNFSEVMGKLAGNVYDKSVTKPHNHSVIDALKEQYEADIAAGRVDDYIRVTGRTDDAELKDLYNLLPYETKQYVKQVFGSDSIPIRAEFLRIIFGYRKISIADVWKDGGIDNNHFQSAVKGMFDSLFGSAGLQRASQFERTMQDIVRVAKSNVVVRMGSTTMMNLVSNTYDLMIQGLTLRDAIADQVTGYKKGIEYVRHGSRVAEIDLLLKADHNPGQRTSLEAERAQLKHLQAINPVGELVEAGLLQTIVMDVNQDVDPFSYSSVLANKVDEQLNKLPGKVKDASKFVLMTRDSASFDFMNRIVQFSDFASRYAMYKHVTTRKNNPLDKASAIQDVITQFVNYDLPTHRAIQYGNDIGVIWFSRYWLRIQKVILKNMAEHPAKVLMGMAMQGVVGVDLPDNADSSMLTTGVLHPIRGLGGIGSGLMANPIIPEL